MAQRADFTADEWKAINAAPVAAGLLVTLSDASGPAGVAKEAIAVSKAIAGSGAAGTDLLRSIAESFKEAGGRPNMPDLPREREKAIEALLAICSTGVKTVESRSTTDAEHYKKWLLQVARQTADASKEGGFLGFGGEQVSAAERSVVDRLAQSLGLPAGA
jgi:hypothetical protein